MKISFKFIIHTAVILVLIFNSQNSIAQPGGGHKPCPKPPCPPPVPITGIEILIGIGGILGLKKAIQNKKKP